MCDVAWYNELMGRNPILRRHRDAIVRWAEAQPDPTKTYIRRLFPRFWFEVDTLAPGTIGSSLRLTPQAEDAILTQMWDAVLKAVSSEPDNRRFSAPPVFPVTVPHR